MEKQNIGVILIATNKYKQFVPQLVESLKKNFLPNHNVSICLFTDDLNEIEFEDQRKEAEFITKLRNYRIIEPYKFPYATLYRYKIMIEHIDTLIYENYDYLFYMDVDMRIDGVVGDEILGKNLVAVNHPAFFSTNGWGSPNNSTESTSYLSPGYRTNYFAGGFQGGKTMDYIAACLKMKENIEKDEISGIMAEWHDETHWNWILNSPESPYSNRKFLTALTPSYCMVENDHLRREWGIANLESKIIALDKNHQEIRS